MNTNSLNRLLKDKGANGVVVCSRCGSLNIQCLAWVNANYNTYAGEGPVDGNADSQWCEDCPGHTKFTSLADFESKMNREIKALPQDESNNGALKAKWDSLPYLRKRALWASLFGPSEQALKPVKNLVDVSTVRNAALEKIKAFMKRYLIRHLCAADIDEGCSPVMQADPYDDNNTFTLDAIDMEKDGGLSFDASSCSDNTVFDEKTASTDSMVNIAAWLDTNEECFITNVVQENLVDAVISDAEDTLADCGASGIYEVEETIDDALEPNPDGDKYLTMRTFRMYFGNKRAYLKVYFGDRTKRVTSTEFEFED